MVMMELDGISFGANNSVQEMDAGANITVQALWVGGPESVNVVDAGRGLVHSSFSALLLPSRKMKVIIEFALAAR
jgi:hypothetical protein